MRRRGGARGLGEAFSAYRGGTVNRCRGEAVRDCWGETPQPLDAPAT